MRACLLLPLLAGSCGGPAQRGALELPIYFTCDTRGRLEPCGCFTGQFGGLTRLKTVLDGEAPDHAVRVDVGDAIAGHEDYDLIEYQYLLRAFAAMHYDALNLGHREAQLTATQLQEIKRSSPVTILSANVLDKASGKPIFDSYRIIERGGFRVALIGVLDPRGLGENLGDGLAVADTNSTLTRCLAEVRAKADAVVLLAFADEAALAQFGSGLLRTPRHSRRKSPPAGAGTQEGEPQPGVFCHQRIARVGNSAAAIGGWHFAKTLES